MNLARNQAFEYVAGFWLNLLGGGVFTDFLFLSLVGEAGGESVIPGLKAMVDIGSELGIENYIFGMPHRWVVW